MMFVCICVCVVQWDDVEDKSTVLLIGAGTIGGLWVTSSVVGAVNGLPVVS